MTSFLRQLVNLNKEIFSSIKPLERLYLIGLLLMPFDSFPIFPTSNQYRPISFFPILLYWLIMIFNKTSIKKNDLKFFITIFIALIYTFIWALFFYKNMDGFYKFLINGFICFIFISATRNFIDSLNFTRAQILLYFTKVFMIASIIPIFLGWTQLLSRIGLFPTTLAVSLTSLFSYRVDISRIQWASGEPAMGFRFLSMCLLFVILFYKQNKKNRNIFIFNIVTLLLLSGSVFGYIFTLLTIFTYYIFFKKIQIKTIINSVSILILSIVIMNIVIKFLPDYSKNRLQEIYHLFSNIDLNNLISLASIDGSFFLRIFNPVIGIIIGVQHFGLGIGGEYYYLQYIPVVKEYFPFALNFPSVANVLYGASIITPKSLYIKIFAEFGIIGITIFLRILFKIYKRIKFIKSKKLAWIFVFIIAMIINNDSYIYYNFLFLVVLLCELLVNNTTKSEKVFLSQKI